MNKNSPNIILKNYDQLLNQIQAVIAKTQDSHSTPSNSHPRLACGVSSPKLKTHSKITFPTKSLKKPPVRRSFSERKP